MKKILLPTDFSDNSLIAIEYAIQLFKDEIVEYYLLNTYETPHAGASMLVSIDDILKEDSIKNLRKLHRRLSEKYNELKFEMNYESIKGNLEYGIREMNKNYHIDLIVMGTKGASGIKEVLVGSNTAEVVRMAECPVLVVPEEVKADQKPADILLAYDGKPIDEENLKMLTYIRKIHNSHIKAVTVKTEGWEIPEKLQINDYLITEIDVAEGDDVLDTLETYVTQNKPDMLCLIGRKHTLFDKIFHKSITVKMAMHTDIPTLVCYDFSS